MFGERYNYMVSALLNEPEDYFKSFAELMPEELLYPMIVLDAFIGNEDRHVRNFDIVIHEDGSTTMAPLYDHGASLLAWVSDENLASAGLVGRLDKSKPFRTKHSAQIKLVKSMRQLGMSKEALMEFILEKITPTLSLLPQQRARAIVAYLRWRTKYLKVMGVT